MLNHLIKNINQLEYCWILSKDYIVTIFVLLYGLYQGKLENIILVIPSVTFDFFMLMLASKWFVQSRLLYIASLFIFLYKVDI